MSAITPKADISVSFEPALDAWNGAGSAPARLQTKGRQNNFARLSHLNEQESVLGQLLHGYLRQMGATAAQQEQAREGAPGT